MRPDGIALPALALALALMLGLGSGGTARAAELDDATERLFAPGALEAVEAGRALSFERVREVPEAADLAPIEAGEVSLDVGAEAVETGFDEDGRRVVLPPAPRGAAHPVLLLFLETVHKSVAELTGGSPFYVKNRFIESFQAEAEVSAADGGGERLVYRPFAGDPNADRMGAFAGLELAFVLDRAVPGGLRSARASAGDYSESITFGGID